MNSARVSAKMVVCKERAIPFLPRILQLYDVPFSYSEPSMQLVDMRKQGSLHACFNASRYIHLSSCQLKKNNDSVLVGLTAIKKFLKHISYEKQGHLHTCFNASRYFHTSSCQLKNNNDSVLVGPTAIMKFLKLKHISYEKQYTNIVTICPKHRQTKDLTKRLHINMKSGCFFCHSCKKSGTWEQLQDNINVILGQRKRKIIDCFSDRPAAEASSSLLQLYDQSVPLKKLSDTVLNSWKNDLNYQVLSSVTLMKYGIKFHEESNSLVLPWYNQHHLAFLKLLSFQTVGENQDKKMKETITPRSSPVGLFGWAAASSTDTELILTNSEIDALAIYQATHILALALPKKGTILPIEILPMLEQFKKITLWFGNDLRAWETAKQFAKKLNEKRCYLIRPSTEAPSPINALHQKQSLKKILSTALPVVHNSIVSFQKLRDDIYSELAQLEQVAGVKWKRFPALNKLLKGHRRGEMTIFTGMTGTGKTTFMSDYSLDLCMQGVNTLWGSFEIHNVRLAKTMLLQYSQVNLSENLDQFPYWADKFQQLPMYFMTFFGQEHVKSVIETMSHAVYMYDIAHVIVDNVQFMMGMEAGGRFDRFYYQDQIISEFRNFATTMNCHVTLVIHPRKDKEGDLLTVSSIFGSAKATQEADNVFILQDKYLASQRAKRFLQVVKNRFDGELGIMPLRFNKETTSYVFQDTKKGAVRAKTPKNKGEEDEVKNVEENIEETENPIKTGD